MDIEEFLKVNIEGYLLNDLENMANYRKDPSKQYGELAYPMIISTIAGMELLGALLDPGKFDKYKGNEYFRHYWEQYLDQKYKNYKECQEISIQFLN